MRVADRILHLADASLLLLETFSLLSRPQT